MIKYWRCYEKNLLTSLDPYRNKDNDREECISCRAEFVLPCDIPLVGTKDGGAEGT